MSNHSVKVRPDLRLVSGEGDASRSSVPSPDTVPFADGITAWVRQVPPSELTPEEIADLEWLAVNILPFADLAVAELRHALINRDWDGSIVGCRRLLGVGLMAGDKARQMEVER